jgi:predicted PurR-regulated permease PerM
MDQSLFRKIIYLITFTVLLIALVMKFDMVMLTIGKSLKVIQPIILGGVIAFILNRPYMYLEALLAKQSFQPLKKHSKKFALLSTYILFLSIIVGLIAFVIPQFSESIQLFYSNVDSYSKNLQTIVNQVFTYLKLDTLDMSRFQSTIEQLPSLIGASITGILPGVYLFTTNLIGSIVNIVLGFILSIYILSDKDHLKRQILLVLNTYIKTSVKKKLLHTFSIINETFGNFVIGQLTEAFILGALCFLGMIIFGFEYALLISVLIGLTSLIPVVGAAIGLIPSVFILLLVNPSHALWFIIYITVLMQIEGNLIYPRVVGGSIGLPSLWVLSAIIIGGGLFGILGMLIGIPLASVSFQLLKADIIHRKKASRRK